MDFTDNPRRAKNPPRRSVEDATATDPTLVRKVKSMRKALVCPRPLRHAIVFLGTLTVSSPALAEPPPKKPDDAARLRAEGNTAIKAGRVHDALHAWRKAWAARPDDASLACDIGRAEMTIENDIAAIEWLTRCVRLAPRRLDPEQIERGRRGVVDLNLARSRVAEIFIDADPGATVTVNREEIGVAPFAQSVYVKPGEIKLKARKGSQSTAVTVTTDAAAQYRIALRIPEPAAPPPPPPPVVPLARSSPDRRAATWWPAVAGAGLTLTAVGLGIGFRTAEETAQWEMARVGVDVLRDDPDGCSDESNDPRCPTYNALDSRRILLSDLSIGAFIAAGVLGVATGAFIAYEIDRVSIAPTLGGAVGRYVW